MNPEDAAVRLVPEVRLRDLPHLAAQVAARVRASRFEPDTIVYIETGARLAAHELAVALPAALLPIWVRRGGHGMKRKLAPLAARLPVVVRDWLRRAEERSGVHHVTRRRAFLPSGTVLHGRRVLVFDDAADTGRTIAVARALVIARGAESADVRTAVIAATTAAARSAVDFFVLTQNCRMPWSADSDERVEAATRAARLAPSHAPRDI